MPKPRPRPATRLARQGRAVLVGPGGAGAATLHPGEGASEGADQRPAAPQQDGRRGDGETQDFANVILEHLRSSGVQQAHKEDRIAFSSITPWPGELVCAEGRYVEGGDEAGAEKRAAIFIGPEFGTVARPDLVVPPARRRTSASTC